MNRRDGGWEKTNRGERVDGEDTAICERVSQIPRRDQKDKTSDVIEYRDARLATDAANAPALWRTVAAADHVPGV